MIIDFFMAISFGCIMGLGYGFFFSLGVRKNKVFVALFKYLFIAAFVWLLSSLKMIFILGSLGSFIVSFWLYVLRWSRGYGN